MGVYRDESGQWKVSEQISGFLGASHYEANLENVYEGLGITGINYSFNENDSFVEDAYFVDQTTYWRADRNKPQLLVDDYTGQMPTIKWKNGDSSSE